MSKSVFILSFILIASVIFYTFDTYTRSKEQRSSVIENASPINTPSEGLSANKKIYSSLGILNMDANGHSIGGKTELTELRRLIENKEYEIIEITYELRGSYGDDISKKIIYNRREKTLRDIFTKNNVIEEYHNVSAEGLKLFLDSGKRTFYYLSNYTDAK